jgi:hypothetical protein
VRRRLTQQPGRRPARAQTFEALADVLGKEDVGRLLDGKPPRPDAAG